MTTIRCTTCGHSWDAIHSQEGCPLASIEAAGDEGATFEQIGKNVKTLPSLIFRGLVEHIPDSEPWRYRAKS